MAFFGQESMRSKIKINNKIVQINAFSCLVCSVSYEGGTGVVVRP
jgi:hypothetical protein